MVLVTGGTGLVGGYLLLALVKKEQKVRAIKRRSGNLNAVKKLFYQENALHLFTLIEWVECDLLDFLSLDGTLKNIETVYHLAGYIDFKEQNQHKLINTNVMGTSNLMNACISSNVKNVIFTSSIVTLDPTPENKIITENATWNSETAHSTYAIAKKKAEMEVWRASQEGLNVAVVYPSIIIGSLDGKRESEKIFSLAQRKNSYSTSGITGFVDVYDVVNCMLLIHEKELYQQSFIISSENKSFNEVIDFLRDYWTLKPSKLIKKNTLKWAYRLSFISKIFNGITLSKPSYYALTNNLQYSNKKIIDALNYSFIPVNESLKHHAKNYSANLK